MKTIHELASSLSSSLGNVGEKSTTIIGNNLTIGDNNNNNEVMLRLLSVLYPRQIKKKKD